MERKEPVAAWLERQRLHDPRFYPVAVHSVLYNHQHQYPTVSDDVARQAFYIAMRLDGTTHRLAEMFALQQPPMSNTDREFLEGHCNGNQFQGEEWVGDMYRQQALEAGVDPKGKVYIAGLARFPGDPEAWVTGRGDVQRLCEQRGWGARGAVNVTPVQREPQPVKIAEDLVDGEVGRILQSVPAEDRPYVDTEDLKEQVREKRQPHWA